MRDELYVIGNGKLFCDKGTIGFIDSDGKKHIYPIKNIRNVFCVGSISLTAGIIKRALENKLTIHFLNKDGLYRGSLSYANVVSGKIIKNQIIHHVDPIKRYNIAFQFILSLKKAMYYLMYSYYKKGYEIKEYLSRLNELIYNYNVISIDQLLGLESNMWKIFYEALRKIIQKFNFEKRVYHPPKGEINALISFGNMLLYSQVYSIIKEVNILSEISYLHSSNQKRYSLALDIADMFKPYLIINTIIYLTNKGMITKSDFEEDAGYTYLTKEGKLTFIKEFDKRLKRTFFIKKLKREISMRSLIKYECLKLKSLFMEEIKEYKSFKGWYLCMS